MTNVWCVHADKGTYTDQFVNGGYIGYGRDWPDLSSCDNRDDIRQKLEEKQIFEPGTSKYVVGAYVGMMARFLFDIQVGDWVITPSADRRVLWYGKASGEHCYYSCATADGYPASMRRKMDWADQTLLRGSLSIPLQYTLRAAKSVYAIDHHEDFLAAVSRNDVPPSPYTSRPPRQTDTSQLVIRRILNLDAKEFEMLVEQLLAALGFENTEVTGKPGDGGVDVTGELNVSNLATVNLSVQVKRYKSKNLHASDIRKLQKAVPTGGQGAFVTTTDYHQDARDAASDPAFPPIGLINGHQLVDLLIEHWNDIDPEFQEFLGLKPGLVPA